MRCWLLVFALGCGSSSTNPRPPGREADVLVAASDDVTVLFRDGDADWQLAPHFGSLVGFDVSDEHYALAAVDPAVGVTSFYTTISEQTDFVITGASSGSKATVSGAITGLGTNGGEVSAPAVAQFASPNDPTFSIEVPSGVGSIAVANRDDGFNVDSLVIKRDIGLSQTTTLDFDLLTEALPTSRIDAPDQLNCADSSRFFLGSNTTIRLASLASKVIVMPHRDQWRAGDRLIVSRLCNFIEYLDELVSPDQRLSPIQPAAPFDAKVEATSDQLRLAWSIYDSPAQYELTVGGDPCSVGTLLDVEPNTDVCVQRWTVRVTEGWTAIGGTEIDVISRAELEQLGVWSDGLELPRPLNFVAFAIRDGADQRLRALTNGTIN
jgi:hypothetical protein